MPVETFTCDTCGDEFDRKVTARAARPKYCSNECTAAGRRAVRESRPDRAPRCQTCGTAGATPREKTNPRDYSVDRRLLCGKCAQAGSWPNALVAISNPIATWL